MVVEAGLRRIVQVQNGVKEGQQNRLEGRELNVHEFKSRNEIEKRSQDI